MTTHTPRIYRKPPSFLPAWVRALTASGKLPKEALIIPRLDTELTPQPQDQKRLEMYRQLCAFPQNPWLPPTWPQVESSALHIHMLTDPKFPLPSMGVVHLRNRIEQFQPIPLDAPLHYACHLDPSQLTSLGDEFDLVTEAKLDGELVWRATATVLSRARKLKSKEKPQKQGIMEGPVVQPVRQTRVRVPEDLGRRYARVAGDFNPIHQHALLAKPFGFNRAIIHGMWSLARCVAACEPDMPQTPLVIDVAFKRPVFLPSNVQITVAKTADAVHFTMLSEDNKVTHLQGTICQLTK